MAAGAGAASAAPSSHSSDIEGPMADDSMSSGPEISDEDIPF
jgi:hypothetical protein